jgi:AcrR family transcriptional regulator
MYYQDKRVVKSREIMVKTLIELLRDRPLSDIKVNELCNKCGVSRSTFYRSQSTLEELLTNRLKDWYYITFEEIFNDSNFKDDLNLRFSKACKKEFDFFKVIYKHNLDGKIMNELQKCVSSALKDIVKREDSSKLIPYFASDPYSIYVFIGETQMGIRYWIENEKLTPEEMNQLYENYHIQTSLFFSNKT